MVGQPCQNMHGCHLKHLFSIIAVIWRTWANFPGYHGHAMGLSRPAVTSLLCYSSCRYLQCEQPWSEGAPRPLPHPSPPFSGVLNRCRGSVGAPEWRLGLGGTAGIPVKSCQHTTKRCHHQGGSHSTIPKVICGVCRGGIGLPLQPLTSWISEKFVPPQHTQ